ncbi:MAG: glycogen/starch synthase [Bacteroidales bacterium]|nr:glycogen/starch synthase [Bacteroidales bacterium]
MKEPKRILYVNSEIFPYLPQSRIADVGRFLPQGIQEAGKEIRVFMPRFGCVNERRNQLHEVIRLSGMNIGIGNSDYPLVIKVASISAVRMQIYFIDNEDFFHKKVVFEDAEGNFIAENDLRAAFFARGVLETVKKLRWKPDIIHCNGWMSHLVPAYLKKSYKDDPIFATTKIVVSLYNDHLDNHFDPTMRTRVQIPGTRAKELDLLIEPSGLNLAKQALHYADGAILADTDLPEDLTLYLSRIHIPVLDYIPTDDNPASQYIKKYNSFYDKILKGNV